MKIKLLALLLLSSLGFADTTTNRLGLTLPTVGSASWGNKVNNNFAILDAATASQSIPNNFQNNVQFSSSVFFTGLSNGNGFCLGINTSNQTVLVPCGAGSGISGSIIPSPQLQLPFYYVTGTTTTLIGSPNITAGAGGTNLNVNGLFTSSSTRATSNTDFAGNYLTSAVQGIMQSFPGNPGQGQQMNGIFGVAINTGTATQVGADYSGGFFQTQDTTQGQVNGIAVFAQGAYQGHAPAYIGAQNECEWISNLQQVGFDTSTLIIGAYDNVIIENGQGVPISSGTAYDLYLPQKIGHGSPGNSWALYSIDPDSSTFVGGVYFTTVTVSGTANTKTLVANSQAPVVKFAANASITGNFTGAIASTGTEIGAVNGFIYQTSTTAVAGEAVGVLGQCQDVSTGAVECVGVQGNTVGMGYAPKYVGTLGIGKWQSNLGSGTTSQIIGVEADAQSFKADGLTANATGQLIGLLITQRVGGDPNNSYAIQNISNDLSYFAGPLDVMGSSGMLVGFGLSAGTGTFTQNVTVSNNQATGSFPDPENITLNGNSSGDTDCIGLHITGESYSTSPPYAFCRSGNNAQIGFKNLTGGISSLIQMGTSGSYPLGSTVTLNGATIVNNTLNVVQNATFATASFSGGMNANGGIIASTVTTSGEYCFQDGSCQKTAGGGGGGSSSLGVNFNGVSVTSPTAQINFVGSGVSVTSTGSTATVTISGSSSSTYIAGGTGTILITTTTIPNTIDVVSNVFPTLAQLQAGTPNKCNPSSGSGTNYTCNFSPSLSAYSNGMSFSFTPDVASTGPVSVAISGLPQEAVFKSSGTVLANYGDLYANIPVMLVYNSTLNSGLGGFVIQGPPPTTEVNVKTLGAHGDAQFQAGCSITSGAATLSCSASVFKASDVGKTVTVPSAITSTSTLTTTIVAYASPTSVVLLSSATKTVTASTNTICWGTLDTTAINSAIARNPNANIVVPAGNYLIDNTGSQGLLFNGFFGTFSMSYGSKLVFTKADYLYGTGIQVLNSNNAKFSNINLYYADESELPMARGSSSGYAFLVNQSTGIQVDGLYIDAAPGVGYWSNTALRSSVSHARVQNTTADGVHLENCGDSTVDDMWASNTGDDALAFVQAVGELPYGSGCTASNVHVRNSKSRGIAIIGGKDITVTGIDVDGSAAPGVYVAYQNTYTMPVNVSILGGTINRAGVLGNGTNNDGLGISSCTNVTASGLSITNSYGNGVNISNTAANIAMSDIIIDTSGLSGFTAQTATDLLLTNIRSAHSQGNGFEFYISSNVNASNLVAYDTSITTTTPLNRAWWSDNAVGPINVNGLTVIDDSTTATGYVIGESASSSKAPMVVSGITTNIKNGGASYLIGDANAQFHLFGNMADLTTANTWGGAQTFSTVGTFNSNVIINNAAGYLAMGNQQNNTSGLNVQSPSVSQTNFTRGNVGSNLVYSVASGSWTTSNNFSTDYAGMLFRTNGDIAFPTSNTTASNTTLTDAQLMATNKLYIKGTTGLMGLGMGATVPSLAQFQVQGTTTTTYETYFSTASGSFHIAISTNGHVISGGPTPVVSTCGSTPNGSVIGDDRSGVISVGGGSVTGCTLTFANSYGTGCLVACTESDTSTAATADISSISPTAVSFGFSATLGGGSIYYNCEGIGSSCK